MQCDMQHTRLLGCGDIGSKIAEAGKGLGMRVVVFRKTLQRTNLSVDLVTPSIELLLETSDYIVNILPSTPQTRGLLSGDVLRKCATRDASRRPAVFINVGRGDVVDEVSLVKALDAEWLSSAVLDVFEVEPLPSTSALWHHPKVLMTPHISAVSYADDVAELYARNLLIYYAQGKGQQEEEEENNGKDHDVTKLLYKIDWDKGY